MSLLCRSLLKPASSMRKAGWCPHPRWLGPDLEAGWPRGRYGLRGRSVGQAALAGDRAGSGTESPCIRTPLRWGPGRRCLGSVPSLESGSGPRPALPLPRRAPRAHTPLSRLGPFSLVKSWRGGSTVAWGGPGTQQVPSRPEPCQLSAISSAAPSRPRAPQCAFPAPWPPLCSNDFEC